MGKQKNADYVRFPFSGVAFPLRDIVKCSTELQLIAKVIPGLKVGDMGNLIVTASPMKPHSAVELRVYEGEFPYEDYKTLDNFLDKLYEFFEFGKEPCNELIEGIDMALHAFNAIDYFYLMSHNGMPLIDDDEPAEALEPEGHVESLRNLKKQIKEIRGEF